MRPRGLFFAIAALLLSSALAGAAPVVRSRPKKKAAPAKAGVKKASGPAESRYKSRELSESTESFYRFDSRGNPLGGGAGNMPARKGGKEPSAPAEKPACSSEQSCFETGSEADAL